MKNLLQFVILSSICCFTSTGLLAQDTKLKNVDPSGTWRWTFDGNGNTIKSALSLDADPKGKVTGILVANDREIKVLEGSIKGNELQLKIKFEMQEREIHGAFRGEIDGDHLAGNIEFKSDEGAREFPWKAERSVEAADLLGTWDVVVETPDGELKSELKVTKKGEQIAIVVKTQDGDKVEAKGIKLEKNHLHYALDLQYEGSDLALSVKGRPYGSKLAGTMEYAINGDSGELDFHGVRQMDAKK
ncbi:hypothetical protein [Aureliella helgolandensis]|uniref:Lipocalin-like domain-containing protein n=1 Tax=Aureliella helgolandensis TaxID=2527968 RepID=A0A518GAS6_9BACT|nr:hypothetical protein [Aureliella helgolandensis]QDV25705.1 hypothetical protein Q31a_40320 [Aureliella helgolandensis]